MSKGRDVVERARRTGAARRPLHRSLSRGTPRRESSRVSGRHVSKTSGREASKRRPDGVGPTVASVSGVAPGLSTWAGHYTSDAARKDQSGAVLPGVEVTATQTATGAKRSAVTDETGSYILTNLPIGPYTIEAALPGFRTYVQTGIVLQVGTNPTVNADLSKSGRSPIRWKSRADAALVESRSSGVGNVIDNQRVLELPLNGRNPTELIFLAGAAVPTTDGSLEFRRPELRHGRHSGRRRHERRPELHAWTEERTTIRRTI